MKTINIISWISHHDETRQMHKNSKKFLQTFREKYMDIFIMVARA